MITGTFQANSLVNHFIATGMQHEMSVRKLALATNVKVTIGSRTLSIAVDNSCGFGRSKVIRNSISMEGEGVDESIIDDPNEEALVAALTWLLKGKTTEG